MYLEFSLSIRLYSVLFTCAGDKKIFKSKFNIAIKYNQTFNLFIYLLLLKDGHIKYREICRNTYKEICLRMYLQ